MESIANTNSESDGQHERYPNPEGVSELIQRAQAGNSDALGEIFTIYQRTVYLTCLSWTGNPTEAEDLAQEVSIQLVRKIGQFRGNSRFSTWLHRISLNVFLQKHRRKRINTVSFDEFIEDGGGCFGSQFGSIDRRLASSPERISMDRAVDGLAPGYRQMFLLHDVEGYHHSEIAELLQCTVGNTKSQLCKARRYLRSQLSGTTSRI